MSAVSIPVSVLTKIVRELAEDQIGTKISKADAREIAEGATDSGWREAHAEVVIESQEWLIAEDGEALAEERVTQDLEDEPELFTKSWISSFYRVSDTDARLFAQEEADAEAEDKDDRDLADEIEADDEVAEAQDYYDELEDSDAVAMAEDALSTAEDALADAQDTLDNAENDGADSAVIVVLMDAVDDAEQDVTAAQYALDAAQEALDDAQEALDAAKEGALERAREEWASNRADEIEAEVKDDALGYFKERYGWGPSDIPKNLLYLDVAEAAADAVATDGAGHFLSGYDGNEVEVEVEGVTYYCYRIN